MNIGNHDIGVCSWSLQPANTKELVEAVVEAGLSHVQLALAPLLGLDARAFEQEADQLRNAGIKLTAGMLNFDGEDYATIARIRETGGFLPDADWAQRRALIEKGAAAAPKLGIKSIMSHVGFVPPKSQDPAGYAKALDRVRSVTDIFKPHGITLLMETGQEEAGELLEFFHDVQRDNVFINFDPANMILYGAGDPIEAIGLLGKFVRHVHVKDATASSKPGVDWGEEVPFGTGQVGPQRFLDALHKVGYRGPLCIEREAGNQRLADVKFAVQTLKSLRYA